MDELKISEVRRKALRRGYIAFGVPFYLFTTMVFFHLVSGPIFAVLFFYIITMASVTFCVYLWSHWIWIFSKDSQIKAAESAAKKKAKIESENVERDQEREKHQPKP